MSDEARRLARRVLLRLKRKVLDVADDAADGYTPVFMVAPKIREAIDAELRKLDEPRKAKKR